MGRIEKRFEDWVLDVVKDNLQVQVWGGGAAQSPNFFPIKNVTALRQAAPITDSIIWLRGYNTDGDGGEGPTFWNATDTRTEDLGTIFATTANAGGTGRWNRLLVEKVKPEMFGAAGDGVTDDTTAINKAYTYLAGLSRPGWLVLRNKYKISAALSITSDFIRTVGEGGLILPSGSIDVFDVGPSNQTRQDVIFDQVAVQHDTNTVDIIAFLGGTHLCKVMNCWFEGSTGIYNATTGYGVNFRGGVAFNNNCRVEGTFFRWLQKGIKDGAAQVNLNIDTNRFANLNNTAVEIQTGGVSRLQSNNFEVCCAGQTTAPVVAIGNGGATIGRVVVEDNHFENNGGTALNGNLDVKINGARTIRLLNNRFFSGATYPTLKAIRSDTCAGLVVDGNEWDSYTSGAVDIPSGVNNTSIVYLGNKLVAGSEFVASGSNGILLLGNTNGSWNFSLGDAAGADAFVVKDSNGTNLLIVDSSGMVKGPSGNSFNVKLGDAAGAQAFVVKDSNGNNKTLAFSNGTLSLSGALQPSTPAGVAQTGCQVWAGTGAPNNSNGNNGDIYFRSDGGASTTIYQKRTGTWTGIV